MNIKISDEKLANAIKDELTKVSTHSFSSKSNLEIAVQKAIQEMAKEKVMSLIKSDPKYIETLNKLIEINIVASFELVAKRIADDLGRSIVSAIEGEFRTYSD